MESLGPYIMSNVWVDGEKGNWATFRGSWTAPLFLPFSFFSGPRKSKQTLRKKYIFSVNVILCHNAVSLSVFYSWPMINLWYLWEGSYIHIKPYTDPRVFDGLVGWREALLILTCGTLCILYQNHYISYLKHTVLILLIFSFRSVLPSPLTPYTQFPSPVALVNFW